MKAKIVVGLGFGDEGKGITTDYLASKLPNSIVVRYTGGHQAGHTVVKGTTKHVFSSFGSGTLRGVPSYLSEHCCFYPPYLQNEYEAIMRLGIQPQLCIHPLAKLTTPYDIAFNRVRESRLRHGSVGLGIGTTMSRNEGLYKIHAVDLLFKPILNEKLLQVKKFYDEQLYGLNAKEIKSYNEVVSFEMKLWDYALQNTTYGYKSADFQIASYDHITCFQHIIFEGAQGILLDRDFGVFPNVTYGYTTSKNAISICNLCNISDIDMYYITRCYVTRHGNGWMPDNEPLKLVNNEQETNVSGEWQGELKVGELDYRLLNYAIACDSIYSYGHDKHLVVTCLDQRPDFEFQVDMIKEDLMSVHYSCSPDSQNFKTHFNV